MGERVITEEELGVQVAAVTSILQLHNVPLHEWGKGKAKTVTHLAREIIEGETRLEDTNGELVRRIEVMNVYVKYRFPNETLFELVEDRQEFKDGRERRRGYVGVSEKIMPGEDKLTSAKRALAEELGIDTELEFSNLGTVEETQGSPSYPGLTTKYLRHTMSVMLPDSAFKIEGYVEEQEDKKTFFVWREITPVGNYSFSS